MTITPPSGLVDEWFDRARLHPLTPLGIPLAPLGITRKVAEWAAQWGADQELEACCALMDDWGLDASDLRAARRPKPLRLKQQALALIDLIQGNEKCWDIRDLDVVRRALEGLPDDRT